MFISLGAPPPPPPPPPIGVQKKVEIRQTNAKPPTPKQLPPPSPAGLFGFNPAAIKLKSTGSKLVSTRGSTDKSSSQESPNMADIRSKPSPQVAPRPTRANSLAKNSVSQEEPPPPAPSGSPAAAPPPPPPAGPGGAPPPPPPPPPPMGFSGEFINALHFLYSK